MIKLIISDIDGTLADSNGEIDKDIFTIVPELKKRGITFVPASGRPYENIIKRFQAIGNGLTVISDNGAMVVRDENILSLTCFDKKTLQSLIQYGHQHKDYTIIATGTKTSYIENGNEEFIEYVKRFFTNSELVDNLLNIDDEIVKYTICSISHNMEDIYNEMATFHDLTEIKIAGKNWLDVNPLGVSKGKAVRELQRILSITPEETMAFGDYMNDYEMLQSVYYSCAPENACPEIKKIARLIIPSNDDHGVTKTIRELVLNQQ